MIWSNPGTLPKELNLVQELSHHLPRQPCTCKWITRPLVFSCEQQHPCNTPRGGLAAGLHGTGEAAFPHGWMRARGEDAFISSARQLPSYVVAGRQKDTFEHHKKQ